MDNKVEGEAYDEEGQERETILVDAETSSEQETQQHVISDHNQGVAERHYEKYMNKCVCEEAGSCRLRVPFQFALSLAQMDDVSRLGILKAMLIPISAPRGEQNELSSWDPDRSQTRKRIRRQENNENHTLFVIILKENGFA